MKLLLADGRIDIKEKIRSVYELLIMNKSYQKISPTFDIERIEYLSNLSLQDLINIKYGDDGEYDREIVLSKFFWWFRLNKLHGITTSKSKDPFAESLLLETS